MQREKSLHLSGVPALPRSRPILSSSNHTPSQTIHSNDTTIRRVAVPIRIASTSNLQDVTMTDDGLTLNNNYSTLNNFDDDANNSTIMLNQIANGLLEATVGVSRKFSGGEVSKFVNNEDDDIALNPDMTNSGIVVSNEKSVVNTQTEISEDNTSEMSSLAPSRQRSQNGFISSRYCNIHNFYLS